MSTLLMVIQAIVGLGILNVWLLRRNRSTPFRGGQARNMIEEFSHYGLPGWTIYFVGTAKVTLAALLLIGFAFPALVSVAAAALAFFMLVAVLMHIKVKDSLVKTVPSFLMLVMCCVLAIGSSPDILSVAANF